jgi:signal transduction histidine kinase
VNDNVHDNKLQILGKLAASLTHEIKNPLSVLKLNLDYLKMSKEKYDDETIECIDASLEAADLINQLIHNTLEFSRKDKDEYEFADINNIIRKAVNIIQGNANKKNISIDLNLGDTIDLINVNETNILQVFVNIISNGIEASPQNSHIVVNSSQMNGKIYTEVIDEGIGIKVEDKGKLFEDFFTNKEDGTGLGLGVCKTILNQHNAEFSFGNNEGKGTSFKIEFKSKN